MKDTRWALEFTRGGFEFWPWHIISQPKASYFPNFSFLIGKTGKMSFLIGLNDTGKRLSIPWWLSEVYLYHRLLSFLTSKFVCSAIYLSPLNIFRQLRLYMSNTRLWMSLWTLLPVVFRNPVKGNSTRVRELLIPLNS